MAPKKLTLCYYKYIISRWYFDHNPVEFAVFSNQ